MSNTIRPIQPNRWRTSLLRFVAGMAAPILGAAAPANPTVIQIGQVGGGTFSAQARGDEYQGWLETTDNHTIIRNDSEGGRFEYAAQDAQGNLIPSGITVSAPRHSLIEALSSLLHSTAPGLAPSVPLPPPGLRPPRNTALEEEQHRWISRLRAVMHPGADLELAPAAPGLAGASIGGVWAPRPVTGAKKLLVILVSFSDVKLTTQPPYWNQLVFGPGKSSVAAYYQDNSYGKVTISPVPHTQPGLPPGIVTVSLNETNPNYGNAIVCDTKDAPWVTRALQAVSAYVDFEALDTNRDGTISVDEALIYFVLAGYEAAAGSGRGPAVWAHRCGSTVTIGDKTLNNFALSGELYGRGVPMHMGVIAHEMGHAMGGLPDLYDISNTNAGLGAFSLMAFGAWGAQATEIPSTTPVGMDAWSRQYLGWSAPRVPANGDSLTFTSGLADPHSAVLMMNSSSSNSEYWLVENRPPAGWDAGLFHLLLGPWKGGLLIQHIDANIGTLDANSFNKYASGGHQGNLAVEPSTARCDLMSSPKAVSCPSLLFYSGNATTYDDLSNPAAHYYTGVASSLGISQISAPGDRMTAILKTPVGAGGP